ncbi:conserved membrane hypothetical protein [Rhodococcus sp. RD6.2]|nr:conserved membrane hypothetical protein [Rhodococcus sp. RD6.2]
MPLARRSALPTIPGVPALGAVAIAVGATFLGFLIDAIRGTELTSAFSVFYFLGCLAAVLAVRNRGLFTAMVQPPLLLVVAVPLAYQFFTPGGGGLKDLAFNVAIPLVNRFPLMALTTAAVILVGAGRMYIRRQAAAAARPARKSTAARRTAAATRTGTDSADATSNVDPTPGQDARVTEQPTRRAETPAGRPAHAPGSFPTGRYPSRSRHSGPPEDETETFDRPRQYGRSPRPDADVRAERPQQREPRRAEPPRREPPRHEPPRHEPPRQDAPRRDLPRYESLQDRRPAGPSDRHRDPETPLHPIPQVRYRDRDEQDPPYRYR